MIIENLARPFLSLYILCTYSVPIDFNHCFFLLTWMFSFDFLSHTQLQLIAFQHFCFVRNFVSYSIFSLLAFDTMNGKILTENLHSNFRPICSHCECTVLVVYTQYRVYVFFNKQKNEKNNTTSEETKGNLSPEICTQYTTESKPKS